MTLGNTHYFSVRFGGRMGSDACRSAVFFHLMLSIALAVVFYIIGRCWGYKLFPSLALNSVDADGCGTFFLLPLLLYYTYLLMLLMPSLFVRRLRDAGRSPALIILWYISLPLLVWPLLWLYWAFVMELPASDASSVEQA